MSNKLLLVTFPVDLGSTTFERRFITMFESCVGLDLEIYRFAVNQNHVHAKSIFTLDYLKKFWGRTVESRQLQKVIARATAENRKILFNGISPAMFAYPATHHESSYIVTDWTRKLFAPIWGHSGSPFWLTFIHKKVLNAQKYVFGVTDPVVRQIANDYEVPATKVKKLKLPFASDLKLFSPGESRHDNEIRILFVGGDFHRKGGDVLLDWFNKNRRQNLRMTMLTRKSENAHSNVSFVSNVQYGEQKHTEIFREHDILVLPTKCDAYPSVIGEAACAGLAVLTTKHALGASEVISNGLNGYIAESQQDLLLALDNLIQSESTIERMKKNSRKIMEEKFEERLVANEYINYIFE